jgi:hypothetical protein
MKIELTSFQGLQPKVAAHLLGNSQAQVAENVRAEKGDLRAWRAGLQQQALSVGDWQSLYQYISDDVPAIGTQWVYSENDLNFAKAAIANDAFERLYYTGEAEPRVFANDLDSDPWDHAADFYKLGPAVPADTGGWGFVSGHTGGSEYRAYVYTYVSRYGEETGPIKTVLATEVYNTGDVIIEDFTQPPAGYGLRSTVDGNIPLVRVYRVNASITGAEFQYVGAFNATTHTFGTSTFTDDVDDADLGEVLPTEIYEGINANLKGLIGLSNGIFAGFVGNELHLSELYLPHAWPDEYVMIFDYDIVGLGVDGTNIIVLTKGYTYVVAGPAPEAMYKQRLPGFYPCISKRGVASTPFGVLFPSHEGLIKATSEGQTNATFEFMSPEEWGNYRPATISATFYNNKYFGWISYATEEAGIIFDIAQGILTTNGDFHEAGYISEAEGKMYTINPDNAIVEWEGDPYNFQYFIWKSKKFLTPQDMSFTCGQLIVDIELYNDIIDAVGDDAVLEGLNAEIFATGDLTDTFNADQSGVNDAYFNYDDFNGSALFSLSNVNISSKINFKLYVDGTLVFQKSIENSNYFRVPPHRGRRFEIQLEGYIPVRRLILAQSPSEIN